MDFEALERDVLSAMRDQDALALDRLLSDDFVITTAGWIREPVNKQTWIESFSAQHSLDDFQLHEVVTRPYGDIVVTLVHSTQSGTFRDSHYSYGFRYTDVWLRGDEGEWRLDVRHATLVG